MWTMAKFCWNVDNDKILLECGQWQNFVGMWTMTKFSWNMEIEKIIGKWTMKKMLLEYGRQIVVKIRKITTFLWGMDNDKILLGCGQ